MKTRVVEGVDHSTGDTRRLKVQAHDELAASQAADRNGVTARCVYVQTPEATKPSVMVATATPLDKRQKEASRAGRRLRAADNVLSIIGWVYIVVAVLVATFGIASIAEHHRSVGGANTLLSAVIASAAFGSAGILLLGAGAALRMLAVMGEKAAV